MRYRRNNLCAVCSPNIWGAYYLALLSTLRVPAVGYNYCMGTRTDVCLTRICTCPTCLDLRLVGRLSCAWRYRCTRHDWRAWIETQLQLPILEDESMPVAPAMIGGRGLKPSTTILRRELCKRVAPAMIGGRGLKPAVPRKHHTVER